MNSSIEDQARIVDRKIVRESLLETSICPVEPYSPTGIFGQEMLAIRFFPGFLRKPSVIAER
jgi:hypothetical protein